MKNVPVPVYCRPLVEKDPNRKVRRSGDGNHRSANQICVLIVMQKDFCAVLHLKDLTAIGECLLTLNLSLTRVTKQKTCDITTCLEANRGPMCNCGK